MVTPIPKRAVTIIAFRIEHLNGLIDRSGYSYYDEEEEDSEKNSLRSEYRCADKSSKISAGEIWSPGG
jgi:hypothetical protein